MSHASCRCSTPRHMLEEKPAVSPNGLYSVKSRSDLVESALFFFLRIKGNRLNEIVPNRGVFVNPRTIDGAERS